MGESDPDGMGTSNQVVESDEHRYKKMTPGETLELVSGEVVDFPSAWHDRRSIMNVWLFISGLALVLAPIGFLGVLLSIIGALLHVFRCCKPKRRFAGKMAAKAIFILALIAAVMDAAISLSSCFMCMFLLGSSCRDKQGHTIDKSMCNAQEGMCAVVLGMAFVLLVHMLVSIIAFVVMRDCYLDIQRSESADRRVHRHHRHHHHHRSSSHSAGALQQDTENGLQEALLDDDRD